MNLGELSILIIDNIGRVLTVVAVISFLLIFFSSLKNIIKVLFRIGKNLTKRKIAIISDITTYNNLKSTLIDSGLFLEKNIDMIDYNSIKKSEKFDVLILDWASSKECIDDVLYIKKDDTPLIVYSNERNIDKDSFLKINSHRNSSVVNFRGRLLNDIFSYAITTNKN